MSELSESREAFDAGVGYEVEIKKVEDGTPFVIIPDRFKVESLAGQLPLPVRNKGVTKLGDYESFVAYVKRYASENKTLLYAAVAPDRSSATFTAILNASEGPTSPNWGDFRAMFTPVPTVEWERFKNKNKVKMSQTEFAEFIEENAISIVNPSSADMLEVALHLQANTKVEFISGVKLQDGTVSFRYEEITEAKGKGELAVPSEFKIGVKIFEGGFSYELSARLRFRIENKALVFWYELVNPHLSVQDALETTGRMIERELKIEALSGSPS